MKTQSNLSKVIITSAVASLASVWSLAADTGGSASKWYIGVDEGGVFQQDVGGIKVNNSVTVPGSPTFKFDPGMKADLNLGYKLTENWAVELESGFSYNSISQFPLLLGMPMPDSKLWQVPVLVNGVYKYSFNDHWQLYGGAGVGGVVSILDLSYAYSSDTDLQFGYQVKLDVTYIINSNWECDLGYKFLGTLDHEWTVANFKMESDPTYSHSILLSLTYKF
jgi:opacity protein-like surface antigen